MSETAQDRGRSAGRNWGWYVGLAFLLYILSPAPVSVLVERGGLSPKPFNAFYWPLAELCATVPAADLAYQRYFEWWRKVLR